MSLVSSFKQFLRPAVRAVRRRRFSAADDARWHGATDERQAVHALATWAQLAVTNADVGAAALTLGSQDGFHRSLDIELERRKLPFLSRRADTVLRDADGAEDLGGVVIVLCAYRDARPATALARKLVAHPTLGNVPFEYVAGLERESATFSRLDEYARTRFVSPSLLDDPTPYDLYEESLEYFEQKCGLRDYLDLYQCLKHVVEAKVMGDIAEFGSFRGHSGWLIARSLSALGSGKQLYMFDTFEQFPQESAGVDYFWSETHGVDFAEVRAKFESVPNATLVKGEFTRTVPTRCPSALAMAFVDCDSYRATRWLLDEVLPDRVSRGGVVICEDYGHPALLGSRAAVHDAVEGTTGYFRFFSDFSGCYVLLRL